MNKQIQESKPLQCLPQPLFSRLEVVEGTNGYSEIMKMLVEGVCFHIKEGLRCRNQYLCNVCLDLPLQDCHLLLLLRLPLLLCFQLCVSL